MPPTPDAIGQPGKLRLLLSAGLLATLGACANYSGIETTSHPLDASTLGLNNVAQSADATKRAQEGATQSAQEGVPGDWWLSLPDKQLTQLIEAGIARSPGLRATQARLALAQAQLDIHKATDGPQVNAELDLTHQLFSANSIYPPPFGGSVYDSGTLQATAGWELDFFGKNSAAIAASVGQLKAVQADQQAARGLLAANIAHQYYQLARIEKQLTLTQRQLSLREQLQQLVTQRLKAGLDTRLDWEQSRSTLPQVKMELAQLVEQKNTARNALAALTAQPAESLVFKLPDLNNADAPPALQSVPLNLLSTRADITAALWRIEAAQQDVKSAKAQFYPNINLMAYAGYSSIGFDKLLKSDSLQWGIGPAIQLPLFEGGRLRAQLSGKTADLDAAIESYNGQVLQAVHEVADQIAGAQSIAAQQEQQAAWEQSVAHTHQFALSRYEAGLGTSLTVLQAEIALLSQQRSAADLAARAWDARVQLLRALGNVPQSSSSTESRSAVTPVTAPDSHPIN